MTLVEFGGAAARTPWPRVRHRDEALSLFERRVR
jgi:hypothetical protein